MSAFIRTVALFLICAIVLIVSIVVKPIGVVVAIAALAAIVYAAVGWVEDRHNVRD
jgi:O-antigen ligase